MTPDTPIPDPTRTGPQYLQDDPPIDPAWYLLAEETLRRDQHFERMLLVKELAVAAIVIALILLRIFLIH
jgi:hypothetical protein